jgi:hypothetical protein
MLALVFIALFAFAAFAVLSTYAPELREEQDDGTHALSRSAVGFAGIVALLRAEGTPVLVSRASEVRSASASLVVLTPGLDNDAADLNRLSSRKVTLVVLPKWAAAPDALRPGWVRKVGLIPDKDLAGRLLSRLSRSSTLAARSAVTRPVLKLAEGVEVTGPDGAPMALGLLRAGPIDRLQTISGEGWTPILVDEHGRMVLAASEAHAQTYVLADPDLLNTQGVASLDTARAATALIGGLRSDDRGVVFDVTLAGLGRSRSLGKLMLEPPMLGGTLCIVAAALLMGFHALVRFGPAQPPGRAFALGASGLVDSSAGLVRMGRKEAELAQPYAALTEAMTAQAAGAARGEDGERLDQLERLRRTTSSRRELAQATAAVRTPADLLAVARRWRLWRLEMTRDRR